MKLTTTLNLLKKYNFNKLEILLDHIGYDYHQEKPINLLTILNSCGLSVFLETFDFKMLEQSQYEVRSILRNIVADMAESVLHIFEEKYPENTCPREAIQVCIVEKNPNILYKFSEDAATTSQNVECPHAEHAAYSAAWAASTVEWLYYPDNSIVRNLLRNPGSLSAHAAKATAKSARKASVNPEKECMKQIEIIKKYLSWD